MGLLVSTSRYKTTTPHILKAMGTMALCMMEVTACRKGGNGWKVSVGVSMSPRQKPSEYQSGNFLDSKSF